MRLLKLLLIAVVLTGCVKPKATNLDEQLTVPLAVSGETTQPQAKTKTASQTVRKATPSPALPSMTNAWQVLIDGVAAGTCFQVATSNQKLSGYSVFVTAAHVLTNVPYNGSSTISIVSRDGNKMEVLRHRLSKQLDVAALILKTNETPLQIGSQFSIGTSCESNNFSGYDKIPDDIPILSKGHMLYESGNDIWAFLQPFAKGGSGAPLLVNNQVVGMINSRILDENNNPTGIIHAIKIPSILGFIDSID